MNGKDETKHNPRKLPAMFLAVAMMLTVLVGSGAITSTVAAASPEVDMELVPHYKDVTYVLDPVTFNQRFDALGAWDKIGDAELADSRLVMDADEGASLELKKNTANYFEARLMFNSTTATIAFRLTDGTNYTQIAVANAGTVTATYTNASTGTAVVAASGVVKDKWVKVGIEFTKTSVIFTATDADGAALGSATVADALLTYNAVTEVSVKSTGTGVIAYADYVYGSLTRTAYTAAEMNALDLNSAPTKEQKFQKMKVEFGDRSMAPGTYSDQAVTHTLYGGELSDRELAQDRYLNQTDMGEMLSAHKETITPVTGTATYQGWDNLQKNNEATLLAYIADQHDVTKDQVTIIDYYMDGVALNYTFNKAMIDDVEKAWFKYARQMADELGAQTAFVDDASVANSIGGTMTFSITKKPVDLDYFYYPTSVDSKKFAKSMDTLSDRLREKTIGAALMIPESFENITTAAKTNPSNYYAMDASNGIWNNMMKKLDKAYQFTDAALGNILQGATYMVFDVDAMADHMGWSVMKDGKLTASPFTVAQLYGSEVVAYGALIVLIAIPLVALLIIGGVFKVKKARRKN